MVNNFLHSLIEFLMTYPMIIVFVHFFYNCFPKCFIIIIATMEYILQLILAYVAITILIKHLEGYFHILRIQKSRSIHSCCNKFLIIYLTITICVQLLNHFIPIWTISIDRAQNFTHTNLNLIKGQESIITCINLNKHGLEIFQL